MGYKEHPEWSDRYPAIDGIAKESKPAGYDRNDNERFTLPETEIREDLEKIINLDTEHFIRWCSPKLKATEYLLEQWKSFASIPHLGYGNNEQQLNMDAITAVKNVVENLEKGRDYMQKIIKVYKEKHPEEAFFLNRLDNPSNRW
jgi:hypothetical protein